MFEPYETRKREVNAVQFLYGNKDQVRNTLTGQFSADFENGEPILKVTTIHGDIAIIRVGDWIIEEAEPGFYYPIKNEIFRDKYFKKPLDPETKL